jgi:hypothetical protein
MMKVLCCIGCQILLPQPTLKKLNTHPQNFNQCSGRLQTITLSQNVLGVGELGENDGSNSGSGSGSGSRSGPGSENSPKQTKGHKYQ